MPEGVIIDAINKKLKNMLGATAIALSVSLVPVAHADPSNSLDPTGFVVGSQTFGLSVGGIVRAGGFEGTWNAQDIVFWCIELTQYFSFSGVYTDYGVSSPDDTIMTLLGQLFAEAAADSTKDEKHSAAFQLAIWEIVYDSGSLDLGSGAFRVLNDNGHGATVQLAQEWLDGLSEFEDTYALYLLRSPRSQDFVTFGRPFEQGSRVPEPGSLALLGLAIFAMAGVHLRRRFES